MATLVSTKKTFIDPGELPAVELTTLSRILSYLKPYRWRASLVLVTILASAGLNLLPALFVKRILDVALPGRDLRLLILLCVGMVVGPFLAGLAAAAQKYLTTWVSEHLMFDLRQEIFEHLHRQSLAHFVMARPGEAISSALNDVQGVGSVISSTLVNVVENLIVFLSTAALLLALDVRLGLLALAFLPLFILPTRRVGRRRKSLRRAVQARLAELTGILVETLSVSGAHLIKVFGAEKVEAERLRRKGVELIRLSLQQTLLGRWFQMLLGLFESAGPALIFGVGGYLILEGRVALGTVVAFVTVVKRLYNPASALAGVHVDVITSYAYFERVFRVLDLEPQIKDGPNPIRLRAVRGEIVFDGVSLDLESGGHTLRGLDLRVRPGQYVALVGPSGAGKTTTARLVSRLYDPTRGRVLLDGYDLRTLELAWLRSQIGVVTQETYLFHGSVLENLRYARPDAELRELEAAARAAHVHDFILSLPRGYETIVGEGGHRLSGGERQRLALARAILKDPRILILDEATSSLDSGSEALIQAALTPLLWGRTSFVITHRLASVRWADIIVVLEQGRIREQGSHEQLMARGGLYARLQREQAGPRLQAPALGVPRALPA